MHAKSMKEPEDYTSSRNHTEEDFTMTNARPRPSLATLLYFNQNPKRMHLLINGSGLQTRPSGRPLPMPLIRRP